MCGLVGVLSGYNSGFTSSEVKCFIELLYIDALRGDDATGVCLVQKDNSVTVAKEATESADFLRTSEAGELFTAAARDGRVLLGHNRKKTMGKNRDEDAHPFVVDNNTVFFHNGTLSTHRHLADTEIDSHALGIHLATGEGNAEEIEKLLGNVYGAYACVWYDKKNKKVHMVRNKDRTLYLAELESGAYVYASELWMIFGGTARNYGKIKESRLLEEHTLYTFDVSVLPAKLTVTKLDVKSAVYRYSPPTTFKKVIPTTSATSTLSKNRAKKIIKDLEGQYVSFWAEEFFPTSTKCPVVIGTDEDNPDVIFKAYMDYSENFIKNNIIGQIIHGEVAHCYFDSAGQKVVCHLKTTASWVPKSNSQKDQHETSTSVH